MRRTWLRSPLPLALAVTLVTIAVAVVVLFATGSFDEVDPATSDPTAAQVMLNLLGYATAELFILWGVFWLVKRSRAKSAQV